MKTNYHQTSPILLAGLSSFTAVSINKNKLLHQLIASLEAKIKQVIIDKHSESPASFSEKNTNIQLEKDTHTLLSIETRFSANGYDPEDKYGQSLEASTIHKKPASLKLLASTLKSHR